MFPHVINHFGVVLLEPETYCQVKVKSVLYLLTTAVADSHWLICSSPQDRGGTQRLAGCEVSAVGGVIFHMYMDYMHGSNDRLLSDRNHEGEVLAAFIHLDMQELIINIT